MKAESLLDRILGPHGLSAVFQPIFQHQPDGWHLHALEALVRGVPGTNVESPEVLFAYVRRKHAEPQIDRKCVVEILEAAQSLDRGIRLGINVHASTLQQDDTFPRFLGETVARYGRPPVRFIIEIVEHSPCWSGHRFRRAVDALREIGFSVALDDVGVGHSNYRMILECRPDCFKIDRYLVAGSHADYHRRAVLRSIVELAARFGATAVAEGVETVDDLRTVLKVGVDMVQGFLLHRPATAAALGHGEIVSRAADGIPGMAQRAAS